MHGSTGFSPYTLMYGRPVRGPAKVLADSLKSDAAVLGPAENILA